MTFKSINKITIGLFIVIINFSQLLHADIQDTKNCLNYIDKSSSLNSYDLWKGASYCKKSKKDLESSTLLILGQVRAMTDMNILQPVSDEDKIKVSELWGQLYYRFGGSGSTQIYRDPSSQKALFQSLQKWTPTINNKYNPGWKYKLDIKHNKYHQMISCQKATRLEKLKSYSLLINNDSYFKANTELNDLLKQNPGPITVGTNTHQLVIALNEKMSKASSEIPESNKDIPECEVFKKFTPPKDANFTQVHDGYNGPENSQSEIFESKEELIESWISSSLNKKKLSDIIDSIDFDKEILVSLSFGKRTNATGNTFISGIDYNSILKSLNITGMIGVNITECKEPKNNSYPFILAIAPRPEKVPDSGGMFLQNFPDGCKPAKSGIPAQK